VFLIGGSAQLPVLRTRLDEMAGLAVDRHGEPQLAVASGAAGFAAERAGLSADVPVGQREAPPAPVAPDPEPRDPVTPEPQDPDDPAPQDPDDPEVTDPPRHGRRRLALVGGLAAAVIAAAVVAALLLTGGPGELPQATGLTASSAPGEVQLSWRNPADAQTVRVYRDSTSITSGNLQSYTDEPGDTEEHRYWVVAEDGDRTSTSSSVLAAAEYSTDDLVARLPASIDGSTCEPLDASDTYADAFARCQAFDDPTTYVFAFHYATADDLDAGFAELQPASDGGDCVVENSTTAVGTWVFISDENNDVGGCYKHVDSDGVARFGWFYADDLIGLEASRSDGDIVRIVQWWENADLGLQ
jgi:hypothetical protein